MDMLVTALVLGGLFFVLVSSVGLLRFPDFYTRSHALGKSDTLGCILILGGLAIYEGFTLSSFKLLLILLFIAVGNPTATHSIARAAIRSYYEMWRRAEGAKKG